MVRLQLRRRWDLMIEFRFQGYLCRMRHGQMAKGYDFAVLNPGLMDRNMFLFVGEIDPTVFVGLLS